MPSLYSQGNAPTPATEGVSFSGLSLVPELTRHGIRGFGIAYKLGFPSQAGESPLLSRVCAVTCRLLDDSDFPIPATSGTQRYARKGYCMDSVVLGAKDWARIQGGDTLFFPFYALDMEPGRQRIQAELRLVDVQRQTVLVTQRLEPGIIVKPQMRLVRLQVGQLLAATKDANGDSWDYKFFHPNDVYPDLQWILRRGQGILFESAKQKNDTFYVGKAEDRTAWFLISQGDKLGFQVVDFDLLGSSDQVGMLEIDVDQGSFAPEVDYDFAFGRVRSTRLRIDAVLPPKVLVTGYEVIEDEREQGMMGVRVRMEYDQQDRHRDCAFRLGLTQRSLEKELPIPAPRIVGAGGVPSGEGWVVPTAHHGRLELFVPQYKLQGFPEDARRRIRLDLITLIDGQSIVVGRLERPLQRGAEQVNDMVFGQWKIGLQERTGEGGIRFSIDYELPEGYFQESASSKIYFTPVLDAPWGPVPNRAFLVFGQERLAWKDSLLLLTAENRKGTLDLFLPFHKCGAAQGSSLLAMNYRCWMDCQGKFIPLGSRGFETELDLPLLRELHIGVREAAVRRRQWLLSDPNLYWVLKVGETEVYRSPVKTKTRDARWPEEVEAHLVLSQADRIQVQVVHKGVGGETDRVVETWQATATDVPTKAKGTTRLKPGSLHRLVIRAYWQASSL